MPIVLKYGKLNILENSGPAQACINTDLHLILPSLLPANYADTFAKIWQKYDSIVWTLSLVGKLLGMCSRSVHKYSTTKG